jgi:chromosome segregation protein
VVAPIAAGPEPARDVAAELGLEALVDLLGPRADATLASSLLGDFVVVEGWSAAWKLVRKHQHLRAVTPEGDLVAANGIRLASPDGAGVAMLEAAEVALERATTELARTESRHVAAKRDFEKSRQAERDQLEAVEALEARLSGRTEAMARLQKSADVLGSEQERLGARQGAIEEGFTTRSTHQTELRERLRSWEGAEADRMRVWEELESKRIAVAADREVARSAWQDAAETLRSLQERKVLHQERLSRIDHELERLESGGPDPSISTHSLEFVKENARVAVATLEVRLGELRIRQQELRAANRDALTSLETARSEYESGRRRVEEIRARLAHLDVRTTEIRLQREAIAERIRRDADAGIDEALAATHPEVAENTDLEVLLESRLVELRRLGPVNPLAAKEYGDLKERHDFLYDQMADVESSRQELRKVISALEEEIELRFQAAYTEVAEAYQKYFSILFPGGKGRVRLVEGDDGVAGLEIHAQPLGKKVSQLSLLSGGERSLAALAFLFAVFEARPSPFYVLDEVEAALDDSNLRRFLKIVDEFRLQAQLLVVTHQQQTMEAADVLYGVTMEPGGSSKVVRKVMSEVDVASVA